MLEIKHYQSELTITKNFLDELLIKVETFKAQTITIKHILFAIINTYGIKKNEYSAELISNQVVLTDLFN